MGAWSAESFGNDDALDWVIELEQAQDLALVHVPLASVADLGAGEYLEAPESSRAIAAAEVVAALREASTVHLPNEVTAWIEAHRSLGDGGLTPVALKAIERVKRDSELKELWEESDATAKGWHTAVTDLERRLGK